MSGEPAAQSKLRCWPGPSICCPPLVSLTLLPSEPLPVRMKSGKQICPFISLVLGLDLTSSSLSLLPPEYNPHYSKCGGMERDPEQHVETAGLTWGGFVEAVGDPPFRDQIPLIAGPSSYLLTGRRRLQLPAKNNCAVPQKDWEMYSVYTLKCSVGLDNAKQARFEVCHGKVTRKT